MRRLAAALVGGLVAGGCGGSPPAPPQPIAFSHRVHATDNKIGCQMCHAYAERSTVAGIPSMARCHGCHRFVGADKPVIQKLNEDFDAGRVIEWSRVYRLPDHVYFTHERHVAAGLACQTCHGPVQTMERVYRVAPLTMGWCVDCHRARKAATDCWTCHK